MADVFISYVKEDRTSAAMLGRALELSGHSVWWDRDLHGGADFVAEIERELTAARAVIVLWSAKSRDSQWVRDEASYARDAGKLVPVRLDEAPSPLGFRQLQVVDLVAWSGDAQDAQFERLLASLRHFVLPRERLQPSTSASKKPRRTVRTLAIVGTSVVAVLVMGLLLTRLDTNQAQPDSDRNSGLEDPGSWTVVVQPFTVPADGSLDAIAEFALNELTSSLATMDLVVQRSAPKDPIDAARYRLEGSVQRVGDSVSLGLQLLTADSGRVVWARTFTTESPEKAFERTEQAAGLVRATMVSLAVGDGLTTRSEDARWELVAAVQEVQKVWYTAEGSWLVAVRHAENALRHDPALVEARFWAAVCYSNRLGYSIRAADALPKAREHVLRVLEANPDDTFVLGQMQYLLELDYAGATESFERARGFGAPDASIDVQIGGMLLAQGRLDEALTSLQSATARGGLDDLPAAVFLAEVFELAGRYGEAHQTLDRTLRMTDDASWYGLLALLAKVRVFHAEGDLTAANATLDRAWRAHAGSRPERFPGVLALLGRSDEAQRILEAMEARFGVRPLPYSTGAVQGEVLLGNLDRAFVWLDRAIDNREFSLLSRLRLAPELAPLRADPRFVAAMARLEAIEKPSPQ